MAALPSAGMVTRSPLLGQFIKGRLHVNVGTQMIPVWVVGGDDFVPVRKLVQDRFQEGTTSCHDRFGLMCKWNWKSSIVKLNHTNKYDSTCMNCMYTIPTSKTKIRGWAGRLHSSKSCSFSGSMTVYVSWADGNIVFFTFFCAHHCTPHDMKNIYCISSEI